MRRPRSKDKRRNSGRHGNRKARLRRSRTRRPLSKDKASNSRRRDVLTKPLRNKMRDLRKILVHRRTHQAPSRRRARNRSKVLSKRYALLKRPIRRNPREGLTQQAAMKREDRSKLYGNRMQGHDPIAVSGPMPNRHRGVSRRGSLKQRNVP